jgi:hypothetical protein
MYEEAIAHFREYLELDPDAKNAAQVKKTIALLEVEIAAKAPPPPPPPAIEPPPPEPPPPAPPPPAVVETSVTPEPEESSLVTNPILWIVVGAVVVAGAGVALGFALSGERDPYGGNSDVVLSTVRGE